MQGKIFVFATVLAVFFGGCAPKQIKLVTINGQTRETSYKNVKNYNKLHRLEIKTTEQGSSVTVWRWHNGQQKKIYEAKDKCNTDMPVCVLSINKKRLHLKVIYKNNGAGIPIFDIQDRRRRIDMYAWGYKPQVSGKFYHCTFALL